MQWTKTFAYFIKEDLILESRSYILVMNNDDRGHHQDYDDEVYWYNYGCEDSEGPNRSDITWGISKEGEACSARGDSDSPEGALERIRDSPLFILSNKVDKASLPPGITVNKDVISCDAKHNEYAQLVQRCVHGNLEDAGVENIGHWERQHDGHHCQTGHENAFDVETDVAEDE